MNSFIVHVRLLSVENEALLICTEALSFVNILVFLNK